MLGQVAPVDTRAAPITTTQLAHVRELDDIRPADVVDGQKNQLTRLLAPRAEAPLRNDACPQPDDVFNSSSSARHRSLDRRVEPVVGDRQHRPGLIRCVGVERILTAERAYIVVGKRRARTTDAVRALDVQVDEWLHSAAVRAFWCWRHAQAASGKGNERS